MKVAYVFIFILSLSWISCQQDEPIFVDYVSDVVGHYSGVKIHQYYTGVFNSDTTNIEAEIIGSASENTIRIVFTPTYHSTDGFQFTYIDGMWRSDINYHPPYLTLGGDTLRFNHCLGLAPDCWTMSMHKISD